MARRNWRERAMQLRALLSLGRLPGRMVVRAMRADDEPRPEGKVMTGAHRSVGVRHPNGRYVDVDEGLAPLIEALWSRGVETVQCCQESQPGFAWIAFPDAAAATAFMEALQLSPDALDEQNLDDYESLESRATHRDVASPGGHPGQPWDWRWSALPGGRPEEWGIAVDFPVADLPALFARLSTER